MLISGGAMKGSTRSCFLSLLFVVLLGALSASAQVDYSTATLRGTITDPQGAVIPAATVTATSAATGISKSRQTPAATINCLRCLPVRTNSVLRHRALGNPWPEASS